MEVKQQQLAQQQSKVLWAPNPGPQTAFLASQAREVMYGGSVGGGKSDAIIALPLTRIWHPKHRSIILRRTRPDLQETIDRTLQLYSDLVPGAYWEESKARWKFPSGAILRMGHAEHEKDIMDYKSFEYDMICFDELTTFTEYMYLFMLLRNRTKAKELRPIIRSGTNPGDIGHDWVFRRFINDKIPYKVYETESILEGKTYKTSRQYIPSKVWDNIALADPESYVAGILELSAEDVAAYLHGDWTKLAGAMFKQEMRTAEGDVLLDPKNYLLVRGIDFGIDDPTCVLWAAYYPALNAIDIVSELYLKEKTLDDIVHLIKAREEEMKLGPALYSFGSPEMGNKQATSNQSISSMMGTQGVFVDRGNTDRIGGWARIANLIARGTLRQWPGTDGTGRWGCPNLARTLMRLQRNTGVGKDPNDIRPRQEDHAPDALRYIVMGIYELAKEPIKTVKVENNENRDIVFNQILEDLRKPRKNDYYPDLGFW